MKYGYVLTPERYERGDFYRSRVLPVLSRWVQTGDRPDQDTLHQVLSQYLSESFAKRVVVPLPTIVSNTAVACTVSADLLTRIQMSNSFAELDVSRAEFCRQGGLGAAGRVRIDRMFEIHRPLRVNDVEWFMGLMGFSLQLKFVQR